MPRLLLVAVCVAQLAAREAPAAQRPEAGSTAVKGAQAPANSHAARIDQSQRRIAIAVEGIDRIDREVASLKSVARQLLYDDAVSVRNAQRVSGPPDPQVQLQRQDVLNRRLKAIEQRIKAHGQQKQLWLDEIARQEAAIQQIEKERALPASGR